LSGKLIQITPHFGVGSKQVNDEQQRETSDYNEDQRDRHSPPSIATPRPNVPVAKAVSLNLENRPDRKRKHQN
jgi:hypothetical protein